MDLGNELSVGVHRLAQELREAIYLRTGNDLTHPHVIQAFPTERCNYKCGSCLYWRQSKYPPEMTLEQWQQALASLREFAGPAIIQFAGGEPFVYKPFVPLVEWCAAQRIPWGVISNGSALSPSACERIAAARPVNVGISVDGATAAVHDASRGVAGSLQQIEAGIRSLRKARDALGAHFPIRIKPTVHRRNLHEMPALVQWAIDAGATTIDFSPVRHATPEVKDHLWLREDDQPRLEAVIEQLVAAKQAGAPIETEESKLRAMAAHFRGEVLRPSVAPCRVGLREFHILPNGDVRTCWFYPTLGNVTRSGAREIWTGEVARAQRRAQLDCSRFGSSECASSCLAHRTLGQDWQRLKVMLRTR